jgi:hypothetical protein
VTVVVVVALVGNACFIWITGARLNRQLAAIREAGDPLSIAELAHPSIPSERNAATYLQKAAKGAKAIGDELHEVPEWRHYPFEPTYPIPPVVHNALKTVFKTHRNVIPLLQQAAACPDYAPPLDYTASFSRFTDQMSDNMRGFRDFARALLYRSWLLTAEGNRDDAVRNALTTLQLARHLDRNPFILDCLVVLSMRHAAVDAANFALQAGTVSRETSTVLDAELAKCEKANHWSLALKNDRALCLDECRRRWPDLNIWFIGRPLWNWGAYDVFEAYTEAVPLLESNRTYREDIERIQKAGSSLGFLGREFFVSLTACREPSVGIQARIRSLRVVIALQNHARKGSNDVPRLSELGLPAETITDPYNGEPLHVKRLPNGWLVYSVGRDLKDDGGKLFESLDVGVGPPPSKE